MGLTNFPNGILATPNLGGGGMDSLMSLWESENIWYVDGDNGSASNAGNSPTAAVALISQAVAKASRNGTIYVRPKTTSASAQSYYVDTIVIPKTKPNMQIIGAGYAGCTSAQTGVQVKPAGATDHLIDVFGAGLLLQNMRLTLSGGTAAAGKSIVHAIGVVGSARIPSGLVIRSCRFENDKTNPSYSGTDVISSVAIGTTNDVVIEGCTFHNCLGGIAMQEINGIPHGIVIRNNIFSGAPAVRDCDILASHGDGTGLIIVNNIFADGVPAASAGATKLFVKIVGAGTGIFAGNYLATASAEIKAAGTSCVIPATFFISGNTIETTGTGSALVGRSS